MNIASDQTDDHVLAEHDRNVRIVAGAVYGLLGQFGPRGLAPLSILEGAVRGAAQAMLQGNHSTPEEVAEYLEGCAAGMRRIRADAAIRPVAN